MKQSARARFPSILLDAGCLYPFSTRPPSCKSHWTLRFSHDRVFLRKIVGFYFDYGNTAAAPLKLCVCSIFIVGGDTIT